MFFIHVAPEYTWPVPFCCWTACMPCNPYMQSRLINQQSLYLLRLSPPCATTLSVAPFKLLFMLLTKKVGWKLCTWGKRINEPFCDKAENQNHKNVYNVPVFCMWYTNIWLNCISEDGRRRPLRAVRSGPRHPTVRLSRGSPHGGRAPRGAARCPASSARGCLAQLREYNNAQGISHFPDWFSRPTITVVASMFSVAPARITII